MTDAEKKTMLKAMVDGETDEVLSVYLAIAKDTIMQRAYPCVSDLSKKPFPSRYDTLQVQIAQFLVNKQGAEGQVTHTESGIQRQYETGGIPKSYLVSIIPEVGVIGNANDED